MRFCRSCGSEINAGAQFCRTCGAKLNPVGEVGENAVSAPATVEASPEKTTLPLPVPAPVPTVSHYIEATETVQKQRPLPSSFIPVGLLLLSIGLGAYYLGSNHKNSGPLDNSTSDEATQSATSAVEPTEAEPSDDVLSDEERAAKQSTNCQANLKAIGLAVKQYIQDYDEQFPPVALSDSPTATPPYTPAFGWADALYPYLKTGSVFQCPSEATPASEDPTEKGFTDYYFNSLVGAHKEVEFSYQNKTILAGDGVSSNARYARNLSEYLGTPQASSRHMGGANYAFLDGHVKWIKPDRVGSPNDSVESSNYTHATGVWGYLGLAPLSNSSSTQNNSTTASDSTASDSTFTGEHFPETRTRLLTSAEIQDWSYAKVRYALNEIYARHGYAFKSEPIRKQFEKFSWYHPSKGRSQPDIEGMLTRTEKANLKLLATRRGEMTPT